MTRDERTALAYFVSMGWTPAQAAGIVANLVAESHLNPAAVGDGGQAYGIAQWHPDRQEGFAALIGKPIQGSSLEDQLAWVHAELQGTEKKAGEALASCTTAAEAGACVSKLYERPADREGEATRRGALAEKLLTEADTAPQGAPTPIPAPIPSPATPGGPMGALALPFLQAILPQVIGLFSGRAQEQISKATGASPDAAAAFFQNLMAQVAGKAGITIPADPNQAKTAAIQAVAAVTSPEAAPKIAELEQGSVEYLNHLLPVLDKLATYEKGAWDAEEASRDAAAARGLKMQEGGPLSGNPQFLIAIGILAMVAIVVLSVLWKDAIMAGFMGEAGLKFGFSTDMQAFVIGAIVGAALTATINYFFGSTRQSAAKDVVIGEMAKNK